MVVTARPYLSLLPPPPQTPSAPAAAVRMRALLRLRRLQIQRRRLLRLIPLWDAAFKRGEAANSRKGNFRERQPVTWTREKGRSASRGERMHAHQSQLKACQPVFVSGRGHGEHHASAPARPFFIRREKDLPWRGGRHHPSHPCYSRAKLCCRGYIT